MTADPEIRTTVFLLPFSRKKMDWVPIKSPTVEYKHCYKEKLVRRTSNGAGNSGTTNWDLWHGVLYTDLLVGTDTLKIKESLAMNDEGFMDNVEINGMTLGHVLIAPYVLLAHPNLNYQVFSRGSQHMHVIQKKGKES